MDKSITPAAMPLQYRSDFTGSNKSKIPLFQRSQSLRLKGEKLLELRTNCGGSDDSNLSRISLTLSNLRAYEPERHAAGDNKNLAKSARSSSSTLITKKTSSTEMPLQNVRRSILKQNVPTTNCKKINSPSEYGSLPSTPIPSPDVEDADSVKSFRSFCSAMSLDTYANQATQTRKKKYVVHCPAHQHDEEEYLTPTQRKERLIRHLKAMLVKAKRELDAKDAQILQLTQEVMDLRVIQSDAQKSAIDKETATGNSINHLDYGPLNNVFHSTKDSGHFEQSDGRSATSSYGSGPLISTSCKDEATNTSLCEETDSYEFLSFREPGIDEKNGALRTGVEVIFDEFHKKELEEMKRQHANEYQELKEKYNDRIENLLQKLSESNTRYFDLHPKYDHAQEKIRQLEKQQQVVEKEFLDQDKIHHQMYLKMYKKGQEAARFEHADEVVEFAHHAPTRVSVPELLQKLQVTESELERIKVLYRREICKHSDSIERDAEITLKFLKDAIYHFLTNKDSRDHLRAIESIMGYSELERSIIERNVFTRNKCCIAKNCKHSDSIERDAEITLKFLKDAINHFLTNQDSRYHLHAIESIMSYSEFECSNNERNIFTKKN